jgi:glycosyl-4,4'-diaponeurosporenoate acyltransferase
MTTQSLDPVLSSAAFWLVAALLVGQVANLVPPRWLATGQWRPPPPVDPRAGLPWIRLWKRWIPDAGGALPGGVPKASLVRRDPEALRRLIVETIRALRNEARVKGEYANGGAQQAHPAARAFE